MILFFPAFIRGNFQKNFRGVRLRRKFIKHKEGIVAVRFIDEITVEELPEGRTKTKIKWPAGYGVCLHIGSMMKIVDVYPDEETALINLEVLCRELEPGIDEQISRLESKIDQVVSLIIKDFKLKEDAAG